MKKKLFSSTGRAALKEREEKSGVSQPVIARMETGKTSPQIDTILKLLAPLGKTLKMVEVE
ncbi:MAG: helix-turn-helix transcriptional regulator [Clostridiaceae bacterium]|nr:helix-turn-helix transcriptional regulator [Clostridiaceae bacterium]